jgi:ribosomal protein S18 acetylase RimI-like enzyme
LNRTAIRFRSARPGDIRRIIELHTEVYCGELGYPASFEGHVVEVIAAFLGAFDTARDRIVVVEEKGALLGSVAIRFLHDHRAQLHLLIIAPRARGRGLGSRLVETAIRHAKSRGASELILHTASDLAAARSIYAAQGFARVEEETVDYLPAGVVHETWALPLQVRSRRVRSDV